MIPIPKNSNYNTFDKLNAAGQRTDPVLFPFCAVSGGVGGGEGDSLLLWWEREQFLSPKGGEVRINL